MIVWRIAERIRFEPAEPSAISGCAVAQHHGRRHHARHARARLVAVAALRVQVLLAEHVVQVHAGARHDHAGARPVRAGDAGARRRRRPSPRCGWSMPSRERDLARRRLERLLRRGSARGSPRSAGPARNSSSRARLVAVHHLAERRAVSPGRSSRSSRSSEYGDQDAARRRRRVGEDLAAAVARARAGSRSTTRSSARSSRGEQPAALEHPVADGARATSPS